METENETKSKCYMLDQGCPVHGYIHGKEAEELRQGVQRLIDWEHDEAVDLRQALRNLLDNVDARDSLAWLEASDRPTVEPRHAHVEGICVPVCGEEENYLQFFPKEHGAQSITSIVDKAGAQSIPWCLANALETPNEPHYSAMIEQYRTESGRSYPALYRVRVHVFVEDVGDEEADKLWKEFDRFEQGDDA